VLLLLDDGIDGLTAVDADRRLAGRSVVEGQRAGDEPYSMIRVGDKLVVGWSEPYAVDLATRRAMSLGTATIFMPAAEANRVWMVDYGVRIGDRDPLVWQVDVVSAEPLQDPIPVLRDGYPQIGIPGGLALETETGLELWTIGTDQATTLEANGPGIVHDVNGKLLVWCSGECSRLTVTDTSTFDNDEFDPPAGYEVFLGRSSRISPSGRYLAALVGLKGSYEGKAVWILDRESGDITVEADPESHVEYVAWAPDGDQLFATSNSYSQAHTVVWRYQISDQEFRAVVLPFGGGIGLVAVDGSVVDAYIAGEPVDTSQCRAPDIQPSGRSGICTFGY
jgi:outer membrane protein assembly factor BamB